MRYDRVKDGSHTRETLVEDSVRIASMAQRC